jgi:hypothetical protein
MKIYRYLLAFSLILILASGCKKDTPLLTPARKLDGTWKMALPVKFYYETEYCDFTTMQLMATENRLVKWVISEDASDPNGNTIRITMTYDDTNFTILQTCLGSTGITPEVRPMFLTGIINGDFITVKSGTVSCGVFNYTSSNLEGNWDNTSCSVWCQHIYTKNQEFKLIKQ